MTSDLAPGRLPTGYGTVFAEAKAAVDVEGSSS